MRRLPPPAFPIADPRAAPPGRRAPYATVCASLILAATVGVAVLSALSLGQAGSHEARAALALVNAVAGV
jgi:hypothetical protein